MLGYANGTLISVLPANNGLKPYDLIADLVIGGRSNPNEPQSGFEGIIDEVRIYNRPLTSNEVVQLAGPPDTSTTTTTTVATTTTTTTTTIGPLDADFQHLDLTPGADWKIDNDEVGWVIEYWQGAGDYHIFRLSPTGYLPWLGSHDGAPNNADFQTMVVFGDPSPGADWKIDNDEVGWVIEYWLGTGDYHVEPLSPTGYAPGTPDPNLVDGLVAYYPFNGNANDESGNANDGTLQGATLTTNRLGQSDGAYYFDGSANIDKDSFTSDFDSLSVSVWFNADTDETEGRLVEHSWGEGSWVVYYRDGQASAGFYGTNYNSDLGRTNEIVFLSAGPCSQSAWQHTVAEFDGQSGTAKIYLNGELKETVSVPWALDRNVATLRVGGSTQPSEQFKGVIDDVRIYNRALSEAEVVTLYQLPY